MKTKRATTTTTTNHLKPMESTPTPKKQTRRTTRQHQHFAKENKETQEPKTTAEAKSGTNEIVFLAVAIRCTMNVALQFERSRVGILISTSEMSQMECRHPRSFQVTWCHRFFRSWLNFAQKLENLVLLFVRWGDRSSATMRCDWLCSTRFGSEEHTRRTVRLLNCDGYIESERSSMEVFR